MATRKVRYKKLSPKTTLPVLRADQVDPTEYEFLNNDGEIATGVEAGEQSEYHLQAALQGAGVAVDNEIPVPPPQRSTLNYADLYTIPREETSTYIRFSQTVEECIGCLYDMTEEDETYLQTYNKKLPSSNQLSEDDFERIMEVFEDTAYIKAPYASVDQTIVAFDEMLQSLHELNSPKIMPHAKEVYEYWKSRRQELSNQALHPTLKFETHQDSDDGDPYVCFRRREVRQTRKTRARDVQSADKLKKLRKELEEGRQLVLAAQAREVLKADLIKVDKAVFESRAWLKEQKIRLGIKSDDEDLINTKPQPQKRKPVEPPAPRPPVIRAPGALGRPAEMDLAQLADRIAEHEKDLLIDIEKKVQNHTEWNKNHVDLTREPLSPVTNRTVDPSFRPAKTQYLMTPPASVSNESVDESMAMDLDKPAHEPVFQFRGIVHRDAPMANPPPAYRRRVGRLGRLWIDRRGAPSPTGLASPPRESSDSGAERFKYDQESDDEEQPVYSVDPFDTRALRFRASVPLPASLMNRGKPIPPAIDTSSHRPALPPPPQVQPQPPAQPQSQGQTQAQVPIPPVRASS